MLSSIWLPRGLTHKEHPRVLLVVRLAWKKDITFLPLFSHHLLLLSLHRRLFLLHRYLCPR